jgi:hypothetical protein
LPESSAPTKFEQLQLRVAFVTLIPLVICLVQHGRKGGSFPPLDSLVCARKSDFELVCGRRQSDPFVFTLNSAFENNRTGSDAVDHARAPDARQAQRNAAPETGRERGSARLAVDGRHLCHVPARGYYLYRELGAAKSSTLASRHFYSSFGGRCR